MLFCTRWESRPSAAEEEGRRSLQVFSKWAPPASVEFKGFYGYADGFGGVAIIEAAEAGALLEAVAPFTAFFDFRHRPILEVQELAGISQRALE